MHLIDWLILFIPLAIVAAIGLYTRSRARSVVDFLAGGRYAGRYLLCNARSEMGAGAVLFVAVYEVFSKAGFALGWWSSLTNIAIVLASIFGFVYYRYRQTRALTLAQFFEMRYSRRFRLVAGGVAFLAGIINYGVIPVIGARFFACFLGLPPSVQIFSHDVPSYLLLMGLFLTISTLLTTAGGQVTVLATNATEGMFSLLFYVLVALSLLAAFNWPGARESLLQTRPHESMVNPFDSARVPDFNVWYVLMGLAVSLYSTMAWQNSQGFNASAITPHEGRMGGILGQWRGFAGGGMGVLLSLSLLSYLQHPPAAYLARVQEAFATIPPGQYETREQTQITIALALMLPIGIKGMVCAVYMMGLFALDEMHLHSWSSILVQDVILPLRKKPFTLRQHLWALRLGIIFVAAFAFLFGVLYQQTQNISLWFGITQAIYTGGAGCAIIGGLYWSRGTAAGAWVGMIVGSVLSVAGIILQQPFWNHLSILPLADLLTQLGLHHPSWTESIQGLLQDHLGPKIRLPDGSFRGFPLNAAYVSFYGMLIALTGYVVVSLLTCRQPHNMDLLLHRGKYAVEPEGGPVVHPVKRLSLEHVIGIDEHFTRGDRWITGGIFGWNLLMTLTVSLGSALYVLHPWSETTWLTYWFIQGIWVGLLVGVLVCVWFTIGCTRDMIIFFRRLGQEKIDAQDDGTVVHLGATAVSAGEVTLAKANPQPSTGRKSP